MNLSVVIPAYNEEDNIKQAVLDVKNVFPQAEIIVVNDASHDATLPILKESLISNLTVITNPVNMGHGYSVIRGFKEAHGDYVLYIDADRQIDVNNFVGGFDVVSGCRVHRSDKLFRKIISFCLKMTILFRYGYYVKDANCPFKIYKRSSLLPLLEELPDSYIIPIACLEVLARKHNLSVATIPTPHKPYDGVRRGFLQILNTKALAFFGSAFFEIINL